MQLRRLQNLKDKKNVLSVIHKSAFSLFNSSKSFGGKSEQLILYLEIFVNLVVERSC